MSRAEALVKREQDKITQAKQSLRDSFLKRVDAIGQMAAAIDDKVKLGALGLEEVSALATISELTSAAMQIALLYCQSETVQVVSANEPLIKL